MKKTIAAILVVVIAGLASPTVFAFTRHPANHKAAAKQQQGRIQSHNSFLNEIAKLFGLGQD